MKVIPCIAAAVLAGILFLVLYLGERQRAAEIRALAARFGLHYLGDALPRSLTLRGTPFERVSRVWNVIDGEPHGVRIIAFDSQVGIGKNSWKRTVIAVESDADFSSVLSFNSDMTVDSTGGWKIIYRPKQSLNIRIAGLTPIQELRAYLDLVITDEERTR